MVPWYATSLDVSCLPMMSVMTHPRLKTSAYSKVKFGFGCAEAGPADGTAMKLRCRTQAGGGRHEHRR